MSTQTATTDQLENAQNVIIGEWRMTAEHSAPCIHLIDRVTLPKGAKTYRFPKVGQATFAALTDGEDMTDSQSIGLTYVDAAPSEIGAKFILTDKLIRQSSDDALRIVGSQLGDGMGRKRDVDIITLFVSLDTALGADNKNLGIQNATACVGNARALKFPRPISVVHHPNAIVLLSQGTMAVGATYYAGILDEVSKRILRDFWKGHVIDGAPFFEDGNIGKISTTDSGYGAIFSRRAMAMVESKAPYVERERDASLRAWEINMIADYIAVEVDGGYGASMRYEIGTVGTSN